MLLKQKKGFSKRTVHQSEALQLAEGAGFRLGEKG